MAADLFNNCKGILAAGRQKKEIVKIYEKTCFSSKKVYTNNVGGEKSLPRKSVLNGSRRSEGG